MKVPYRGSQSYDEAQILEKPYVHWRFFRISQAHAQRMGLGPYGELLTTYTSGYVPLTGYTGHIQTEPTGLIYMRGRFYSPAWHRFMNSDQGVDPNSINQFGYCIGNPLMHADPSGMRQPTEAEEERDHPRPSVDGDQNDQNDQDSDPGKTTVITTNGPKAQTFPATVQGQELADDWRATWNAEENAALTASASILASPSPVASAVVTTGGVVATLEQVPDTAPPVKAGTTYVDTTTVKIGNTEPGGWSVVSVTRTVVNDSYSDCGTSSKLRKY